MGKNKKRQVESKMSLDEFNSKATEAARGAKAPQAKVGLREALNLRKMSREARARKSHKLGFVPRNGLSNQKSPFQQQKKPELEDESDFPSVLSSSNSKGPVAWPPPPPAPPVSEAQSKSDSLDERWDDL
jgi:hypothetical protein